MDKKTKKRLAVLTKKLSILRQQLAGAKKQTDEPAEIERLDKELAALQSEIDQLKSS